MKTYKTLSEVTDGKLYKINDLAKVDTGGCVNCSACCHGITADVSLSPYDVFRLKVATGLSIDDLLKDYISLVAYGKLLLPHVKTHPQSGACTFLNDHGQCSVHQNRPDICRLFPLGRVYEEDDFSYFVQEGACVKPKLDKIKIKKWLEISHYNDHKAFVLSWYKVVKALEFRMKFLYSQDEIDQVNKMVLDLFYKISLDQDGAFYTHYHTHLKASKDQLGII